MMAMRRRVFREAVRRFSMTRLWLSKAPWEKFTRATLMPARSRRSMTSGDSEAGPMVHTIFVLWAGSVTFLLLPERAAQIKP